MAEEIIEKVLKNINSNIVLNELMKEYDIYYMLDFNQHNINEKISKNAYMQELFRLMWITEKAKLNKIQKKLDQITGEVYDKYKFHDSRNLSKVEIEKYYLPNDPEIKKQSSLHDLQEIKTWFFESLYSGFKNQGWLMNQFLKELNL